MFFWNSLVFSMIQQMLEIWSLVPLPFLNPEKDLDILNTWKFIVHILLKPGLENFEHYFTSVWHECNCAVVWAFFGIAFLWDWNENWPFPDPWPLLSFPNLLAYWAQHFHSRVLYCLPISAPVRQNCILSPCLFNYMQDISCKMNHKLESRIPGEITITSDMQMTPP